jgi:hypothetical protein
MVHGGAGKYSSTISFCVAWQPMPVFSRAFISVRRLPRSLPRIRGLEGISLANYRRLAGRPRGYRTGALAHPIRSDGEALV